MKFKTVQELNEKIDAYFKSCEDPENPGHYKRPLTMSGLALALDTNRQTLMVYKNGEYDPVYPEGTKDEEKHLYSDSLKRALAIVEKYVEEYMFLGKNQTGVIFNAKNNFGWQDKYHNDLTSNGKNLFNLKDTTDAELENLAAGSEEGTSS
jgi:hypothetical protein